MVNIKLTAEQGSTEITPLLFVKLLQYTSSLMVAYTIMDLCWVANDQEVVRLTNRVMKATWKNDKWMEKCMDDLFKRAREIAETGDIDAS
jgi:hypothetical protein